MSADKQLRDQLERTDSDLAAANERLAKAMVFVRMIAAGEKHCRVRIDEYPALILRSRWDDDKILTVKQVLEAADLVKETA